MEQKQQQIGESGTQPYLPPGVVRCRKPLLHADLDNTVQDSAHFRGFQSRAFLVHVVPMLGVVPL